MKHGFWNHRVVHRKTKVEEYYTIHEAHYKHGDAVDGKPWGITETGIAPFGETVEELRESLEMMKRALDKPVLEYDDIVKEGTEKKDAKKA